MLWYRHHTVPTKYIKTNKVKRKVALSTRERPPRYSVLDTLSLSISRNQAPQKPTKKEVKVHKTVTG